MCRSLSSTSRAFSAAADRFTAAVGYTALAPWVARRALVPLLVVTMIVFPRTARSVISNGLFPRWNPGIRTQSFSPARRTSALPIVWASRSASSVEATGMMALAPRLKAAHIEVVAQDVDDEYGSHLDLGRGQTGGRKQDVDSHTSGRSR